MCHPNIVQTLQTQVLSTIMEGINTGKPPFAGGDSLHTWYSYYMYGVLRTWLQHTCRENIDHSVAIHGRKLTAPSFTSSSAATVVPSLLQIPADMSMVPYNGGNLDVVL